MEFAMTMEDDGSPSDAGIAPEDVMMRAERLVAGLEFFGLPKGATPKEAFLLIRTSDEEGLQDWSFRKTAGLSLESLYAQLSVQLELARRALLSGWIDDEE